MSATSFALCCRVTLEALLGPGCFARGFEAAEGRGFAAVFPVFPMVVGVVVVAATLFLAETEVWFFLRLAISYTRIVRLLIVMYG